VNEIAVGIGEMRHTHDPGALLVSQALGSCIALMAYDPVRRCAAMLHYMLPTSPRTPATQQARPTMYADAGIPLFTQTLVALGCEPGRLVFKAAGGGQLIDKHAVFDIGRRNYLALLRNFEQLGLRLSAAAVGGTKSRSVRLHARGGQVVVTCGGKGSEL
jgi:chemotaxis protein CheD